MYVVPGDTPPEPVEVRGAGWASATAVLDVPAGVVATSRTGMVSFVPTRMRLASTVGLAFKIASVPFTTLFGKYCRAIFTGVSPGWTTWIFGSAGFGVSAGTAVGATGASVGVVVVVLAPPSIKCVSPSPLTRSASVADGGGGGPTGVTAGAP